MTDALRPPEKHAHLRFHWIIWQPDQTPVLEVMKYASANGGSWSRCGLDFVYGTEEARENGWRYHGPCDPAASAPDPENAAQQKLVRDIVAPDYDHPMATLRYQIKADTMVSRILTALRDALTVKLGW